MTDYPAGGETPSGGEPPQGGWPQQGGPAQGGYQAPGGYPLGQQPKVRPGRIWYLVALAIFAAGLAWLIVGIVSIGNTVNNLQRVPLPAGGTISLGHSGGYIVYYEGPGAQNGQIPGFRIQVAPASSGAGVPSLTQYSSQLTYDVGSHHGRAVLTLHITRPGTFRVTTTGSPPSGSDLAFGGSIASGIVGALLPGLPLILIGLLGALTLLIIRSTCTRRPRPWLAEGMRRFQVARAQPVLLQAKAVVLLSLANPLHADAAYRRQRARVRRSHERDNLLDSLVKSPARER
jgi:hypothetical protein